MLQFLKVPKLAIDFGTTNCIIYDSERGILVQEPTSNCCWRESQGNVR